ncbi:dual specificity protein phosphatase family protein [Reyranella sp.]|uniref:protein-tyrosine phosphatase family protein n=1 Tax=Reyranella sp. TaxID=1929291 RepID=UPI0027304806|nr:dual specificity protein phosphatase [Reyranella sp.]MDP2375778.1 dual specificity protein phosphatase [Reyranella sp.]
MDDARRQAMRAAARRIDRVTERLYVGGAIPVGEYQRFVDAGITHLVDVREDSEIDADLARLEQLRIARLQIPVINHTAPTHEQLSKVANWIEAKDSGPVVYVHCGAGIGRAATIAVGILLHESIPLADAIEKVRKVRPEIHINEDQLAWLRSVEERLQPKKG